MKEFVLPEMNIVNLEVVDTITTSPIPDHDQTDKG